MIFDDTEQHPQIAAAQSIETPVENEQEELEQQPVEQEVKPKQETSSERNLRALREKAERIERERDEAMRRLKEIEAAKQGIQEEDDLGIDPDALVDGKQLKHIHKEMKRMKQELQQYQQRNSEVVTETRLRAQYSDFDKVVTKENVEALKAAYPEIAHTLNSSGDLYNTASAAYTMIKKFGIYQEDNYVKDREIAQKNAAKPRPLSSVNPQQGDSPLSRANAFANGLTDELKEQLYREMMQARQNS